MIFEYLSVLHRQKNQFIKEELIFENEIGRVRDIEINNQGEIFLIADELESSLYILRPN
jgi:quinoprotein glucose dehydrogenase